MRDPNLDDVNLVLRLYEMRREEEMRRARKFLLEFQPRTIDDLRAVMQYAHPENAHFRQVVSYWEMVADFAARGLLHPEMFATHCGEGLLFYVKLEPFRDEVRRTANPRFFANTERAIQSHAVIAERVKTIREIVARMAAQQAEQPPK